ncbi:MAG: hypothetical protein AAFQ94_22340 [Bacteroidota bacterium]
MKNILICFILFAIVTPAFSQSEVEPPIADQFDIVTMKWIEKSEVLKTYDGVSNFCRKADFRKSVNQVLNEIHQYDSLIISQMEDPTSYLTWNKKEEKKTVSDIHNLEEQYGMDAFDDHMRGACKYRKEIETNKESLKNGMGVESYDSKVMLLEADQTRYFKKIDKLVLRIDEHLHILNIDN